MPQFEIQGKAHRLTRLLKALHGKLAGIVGKVAA